MSGVALLGYLVHAVVAGVLVAVIYFDLREMRIPNKLTYVLLAGFALLVALGGPMPDLWMRIALAGVVFAAGFAAFAMKAMGGGDVKILAALALFVPVSQLQMVMLVLSGALLLGTLAVVLARRFSGRADTSAWAFLNTHRMPMGLPIGMAGLTTLGLTGLAG